MHTVYHITSHSIDMIAQVLAIPRRRLIPVVDFHGDSADGVYHVSLTLTLPEGQEERFQRIFEKIYEVEKVEWWYDAERE